MKLGPYVRRQRRELVLAAIQGGCRLNKDIMSATGLPHGAVESALRDLRKGGLAWRAPSGWKLKEALAQER